MFFLLLCGIYRVLDSEGFESLEGFHIQVQTF